MEDEYLDIVALMRQLIMDISWDKTFKEQRLDLQHRMYDVLKELYSIYGIQMHEDFDAIPLDEEDEA